MQIYHILVIMFCVKNRNGRHACLVRKHSIALCLLAGKSCTQGVYAGLTHITFEVILIRCLIDTYICSYNVSFI